MSARKSVSLFSILLAAISISTKKFGIDTPLMLRILGETIATEPRIKSLMKSELNFEIMESEDIDSQLKHFMEFLKESGRIGDYEIQGSLSSEVTLKVKDCMMSLANNIIQQSEDVKVPLCFVFALLAGELEQRTEGIIDLKDLKFVPEENICVMHIGLD